MRNRIFPRSPPAMRPQGPSSNAARAAATARRTSSASASATRAKTSAVAGFRSSKVFPEAASTQRPPINNWYVSTAFDSSPLVQTAASPNRTTLAPSAPRHHHREGQLITLVYGGRELV